MDDRDLTSTGERDRRFGRSCSTEMVILVASGDLLFCRRIRAWVRKDTRLLARVSRISSIG